MQPSSSVHTGKTFSFPSPSNSCESSSVLLLPETPDSWIGGIGGDSRTAGCVIGEKADAMGARPFLAQELMGERRSAEANAAAAAAAFSPSLMSSWFTVNLIASAAGRVLHRSQLGVAGLGHVDVQRLRLVNERPSVGREVDDRLLGNFPRRLVEGLNVVGDVGD
ncbi:MAG: hypothetical protein BJ554DRAFT_5183 [Olpidium bornovanus]|uniref:Uncharacterized protein n=1 Tax=Olpidium bornovanus TaxID=278681 RepID=A0A8H8A009_9FUNG|nr:MAG: hypothetical protein BJ554DRAFT_5183 [Olpidium bornovanus]